MGIFKMLAKKNKYCPIVNFKGYFKEKYIYSV